MIRKTVEQLANDYLDSLDDGVLPGGDGSLIHAAFMAGFEAGHNDVCEAVSDIIEPHTLRITMVSTKLLRKILDMPQPEYYNPKNEPLLTESKPDCTHTYTEPQAYTNCELPSLDYTADGVSENDD